MSADQIKYLLKLSCLSRTDIINEIVNNFSDFKNNFVIQLIKQQSQDGVVHIGRERVKRIYMDILNDNNTNAQRVSKRYCSVGYYILYQYLLYYIYLSLLYY